MKTTRKEKRLLKKSFKRQCLNFPYLRGFKNYRLKSLGSERLDPNDRTWTFHITNKTDKKQLVVLFGSTKHFVNKNVKITVDESSHETIKSELLFATHFINHVKISAQNTSQLNNVLCLTEEMSTGGLISWTFLPFTYRPGQRNSLKQIDCPQFNFVARGSSYIEFEINPREKVVFVFTICIKIMFNDIFIDTTKPPIGKIAIWNRIKNVLKKKYQKSE